MSETTLTLPRRSRGGRWLTALLALLVFSGGIVVGGAGTVLLIVHQARHAIRHPEEVPYRLTDRLTHKLDLSTDQSADVQRILVARVGRMQALRATIRPEIQSELTGIHTDIRNVLDPKQQAKWDKMYDDLLDNWFPAADRAAPAPVTQPNTD